MFTYIFGINSMVNACRYEYTIHISYMDPMGVPFPPPFIQIGDLAAAIILKVLGDLDLKVSGMFFHDRGFWFKKKHGKKARAFFLGTSTQERFFVESHAFFGESVGLFTLSCDFGILIQYTFIYLGMQQGMAEIPPESTNQLFFLCVGFVIYFCRSLGSKGSALAETRAEKVW